MPWTTRRIAVLPVTLLCLAALAGCSSDGDAAPTGAAMSASPTPSSPPPLPPVDSDVVTTKAALVTAADLGAPWVQPKAVNSTKLGTGLLCPGQPNDAALVKPRASERVQLTEGAAPGAAIGSFFVRALTHEQVAAWRAAVVTAEEGCRGYKATDGTYVVVARQLPPVPVAGAEEVLGHLETVYSDAAHTKFLYVRQLLYARNGRIVSAVENAVVPPAADPKGLDFTGTAGLLATQVAKSRAMFGIS